MKSTNYLGFVFLFLGIGTGIVSANGTYQPNEEKYVCIVYDRSTRFEFTVKNLNSEKAFDLDDDDCAFRLKNEINGYDQGGESEIARWRFRSDPGNGGNC
ncbi:hypothetical protein NM208_g3608 [Fusarium decemcellulare]|uniref:Uncharacterized protein n=1 Tax=Fusarium decemcellulare TaxID=57161 RepID=A0ACC1SNN5_9HYPO|nr:hypothetical protein NM208_g3608 [Fusarium decemcellulare]